MNADILRALMQLFAILGKMEGERGQAREVVRSYLSGLLSEAHAAEFMDIYDQYSASSRLSALDDLGKKRISRVSVKVIGLCDDISKELSSQHRIIVVLRILEFISGEAALSEMEMAFFEAVASSFGIAEDRQRVMLRFFLGQDADGQGHIAISTASGGGLVTDEAIAGMGGELRLLHLEGEGIIAIRAVGMESQLVVNGQMADPRALHIIGAGGSLKAGRIALHYADLQRHFMGQGLADGLSFEAVGIAHTFKNGHIGIHPLTFRERSGTLVGIMGGSGAGKSTLLGILNGSARPSSGQVLINGRDLYDGSGALKGVIGFVSQDDLLIEELTVFDNLYYAAKLCFANMPEQELRKKVDDLLADLGLDGIAHLQVGGVMNKVISGGQRKRLNIALELIREPQVLFADEPTSGLSSSDSEQVIELLRQQAAAGRLVFVVIHQPSSDIFKRFDRLLMLDKGGYAVYYGSPLGSVAWFKACANHVRPEETECPSCGNVNPEQVFNILEARVLDEFGRPTPERKVTPQAWYKRFWEGCALPDFQAVAGAVSGLFEKPGAWGQYLIFLRRDAHAKLKNGQFLALVLAVPLVLAGLLSMLMRNGAWGDYVFQQNANIPAYLFISVIVAVFLGLMLSAEQIFRDRLILKREAFIDLSPAAYLCAKVTVLLAITALQAMIYTWAGNTAIGLSGMYLPFWGILFATGAAATMMGLFISATLNSIVTIYITIPLIIIPQILLSGVLVKYHDLFPAFSRKDKTPLVGELMVSKWAFEALVVKQFRDNAYERQRYDADLAVSRANFFKVHWANLMEDAIASADGLPGHSAEETAGLIEREFKAVTASVSDVALRERLATLPPADCAAALRKHFRTEYEKATNARDALLKAHLSGEGAKLLRERHTNDRLREMVESRSSGQDFAIVAHGRIVPTYDPVYLLPEADGLLRARLFSPKKPLLGRLMDTYWANLLVILLMAGVLFPAVLRGLRPSKQ